MLTTASANNRLTRPSASREKLPLAVMLAFVLSEFCHVRTMEIPELNAKPPIVSVHPSQGQEKVDKFRHVFSWLRPGSKLAIAFIQ